MSVLKCECCEAYIDSDDDPAAYDESDDTWLCWRCRMRLVQVEKSITETLKRFGDDKEGNEA